jgi:hypothetical protein
MKEYDFLNFTVALSVSLIIIISYITIGNNDMTEDDHTSNRCQESTSKSFLC